jgi:CheY-like chemotaxis protein
METILLVDDNPLRASLRQSILEGAGATPSWAVVRAMDASEALCLVESPEFAESLALVVTGNTMSGISGPEFAAELRSRMPQVPVLVLSSTAGADREFQGIDGVFLAQTTAPDDLRALVGRLANQGHQQSA